MDCAVFVEFEKDDGVSANITLTIPADSGGLINSMYRSKNVKALGEVLHKEWGTLVDNEYRRRVYTTHYTNGTDAEIKTKIYVEDLEEKLLAVVRTNEMEKYMPKNYSVIF